MLFLFYQATDELLSETTPDTYSLPLHNAITLIDEIAETYYLLKTYNMIDEYYIKYISPIIDELFSKIEEDYLLKRLLGSRIDSIITGLKEAKNNSVYIERWISIFNQSCSRSKYRTACKDEIERLIIQTKDKDKLLFCMKNYYIHLLHIGYSREYIYTTAKKYFSNYKITITTSRQIVGYLRKFSYQAQTYNFLVLMDLDSIEYLDNIDQDVKISQHVDKVDLKTERAKLSEDLIVNEMIREYDKKTSSSNSHQKISIVRLTATDLDPYSAAIKFSEYVSFLQIFKRYFIHHSFSKQVYSFLLQKRDGKYVRLNIPNEIKKRPYIAQSLIDSRIKNILVHKSLGDNAFESLAQALEMHAEAFDSKSTLTLFRSLWSALETLFSNPGASGSRKSVLDSVLLIIQKTYILKILRSLYYQVVDAIEEDSITDLGIGDFASFVEYFSRHAESSVEMKKIYGLLEYNPLLRSRLFAMRKKLTDGKHISEFLSAHRTRILWQLQRLYRIRNIATHLGKEVSGTKETVNHLHSYFDYAVNYMLCKSENGDYVSNISTLVFECENDIRIHTEMLKENMPLSQDTYMTYLFGPDKNLIEYKFEH